MASSTCLVASWLTCIVLLMNAGLSFQKIPAHILGQLQGIQSTTEFISRFLRARTNFSVPAGPGGIPVSPGSLPGENTLFDLTTGRLKPQGVEVIAASTGDMIEGCEPHPAAMTLLTEDNDPNVLLWPPCVQVMRCGGCCFQDGHHCVATETTETMVPVVRARYPYTGAPDFDFDGLVDMRVVNEQSCVCQCRIQAHHCDPLKHTYDYDACRCRCNNEGDLASTCQSPKMWNQTQCECMCPEVKHCRNENEMFNFQTCSCEVATAPVEPAATTCNVRCRPRFTARMIHGICQCIANTSWGNRR